jgi:urease gamma subunit
MIRDGRSVAEIMSLGAGILTAEAVMVTPRAGGSMRGLR